MTNMRRARARELSTSEPPSRKGAWRGNGAGRGGPARGAGRGGPARGAGFGGPANGAGVGGPANGPGVRGWARLKREEKLALKEWRKRALEDFLFDLAFNAPDQATQLNAAAKLHAIYNGAPVFMAVAKSTDELSKMPLDAIRAELERYNDV